ncbi:MAG: retropepsin-like aspartic protease [Ignavibacteriae bacterium]|nr:retropepsin-like aspartic protease [Ignavibacteriota bacterium]
MSLKFRHILILFISLLLFSSISFTQDFETLYNYYKKKDFFVFRDKVKYYSNTENVWQEIFLKANENNIFGNFDSSNKKIKLLLDSNLSKLPDSILTDIYEIKASNHINLFEYKDAYETALLLNSNYSAYLDTEEKEDAENELIIWKALQNAPPQRITKTGNITLSLKKDFAGLWNIPVKIKDKNYGFIFDTGANFCVIIESLARKLGFEIIENAKFKVGTATGKKVESKIGISKLIKFGDVIAENVIFIIIPDDALDFGIYKIEGIIGNPILRAFGEVIIKNGNELVIPQQPEKSDLKNLAFDGFTPVIQMIRNSDSLSFVFDSGGQSTYLYRPYYLKYTKEITSKNKPVIIKIGGAGGSKKVNGYIIDKIFLKSGNANSDLEDVSLITDIVGDNDKYFYGNLGQDYFTKFSKIKINYADMYIEFVK